MVLLPKALQTESESQQCCTVQGRHANQSRTARAELPVGVGSICDGACRNVTTYAYVTHLICCHTVTTWLHTFNFTQVDGRLLEYSV